MLVEKHPRWVRWAHWIHFPVLFLMIWSGILIYWANDVYRPFFPDWFYSAFSLDHQLAKGMAIHFAVMWIFAINGLLFAVRFAISGHWREIFPDRQAWRDAPRVMLHEIGLSRQALPLQGKFNAGQRIAYSAVILMGALSTLSGLAIYKPVQLHLLASALGGYDTARLVHFLLTIGYLVFFAGHVALVIRAGWNNFRAMVAGFEIRG